MTTAKLFDHAGVRAIDLPEDFPSETSEVEIERNGDELILRPRLNQEPKFETLNDFARYMQDNFPEGANFPDVERLPSQPINLD